MHYPHAGGQFGFVQPARPRPYLKDWHDFGRGRQPMAPHPLTPSPDTHNHPCGAGGPRPRRRYRSTSGPVVVRRPGFVAMSDADEGRAVEALAELLAPLFATPPAAAVEDGP